MEESAQDKETTDNTLEADQSADDQNENHQGKTYVLSQAQHNQFQNQKQLTNLQVTPAATTAPQDELKSLAMMMQQLLQGQQMQGKALNQMDIQIAQTAESVTRQQGTLPGKTDKNPKECNAVGLRSGKQLSDLAPRKFTAAEKGKQKESEQPPSDAPTAENEEEQQVETNPSETKQPAEAVRPSPEPVPGREYVPKVPYSVPTKATRKDREEMKCRKMLEDLTVRLPLMDAIQMMPSMRSFMKGLISGKISEDSKFTIVSKECSVVLQNKPIKKQGDPGKFVLSVGVESSCGEVNVQIPEEEIVETFFDKYFFEIDSS
ncbi:hypothetical protein F2Q69_00036604 [Brassica cretica]|uniref:Uncharacterized protein n=1 Tax=Brassica cretica TaxID=69181 RepID=A0A8S9SHM9_BRACR|nr:hypothetical protein F2Q69_00036604 [Brassica cretica]